MRQFWRAAKDGWVAGFDPALLAEFDVEKDTVGRLGMPEAHQYR
jgi:hypothetical protein